MQEQYLLKLGFGYTPTPSQPNTESAVKWSQSRNKFFKVWPDSCLDWNPNAAIIFRWPVTALLPTEAFVSCPYLVTCGISISALAARLCWQHDGLSDWETKPELLIKYLAWDPSLCHLLMDYAATEQLFNWAKMFHLCNIYTSDMRLKSTEETA